MSVQRLAGLPLAVLAAAAMAGAAMPAAARAEDAPPIVVAPMVVAQAAPAVPPGTVYKRPDNVIGTGQSLPLSNNSSNITPGDTRSVIAPRLPAPPIDENSPPGAFLRAARAALAAGHTGEGQEALERAESRALDRSVRPSTAGQPSQQSLVQQITEARGALSSGDRGRAIQLIDVALQNPEAAAPAR
jgi:hypothetical protein